MIYWRFPPYSRNPSQCTNNSISIECVTRLPYELYIRVCDTRVMVTRNRDLNHEQVCYTHGESASDRKVEYDLRTGRDVAELTCKNGEITRNSSVNICSSHEEKCTGQRRSLIAYRHSRSTECGFVQPDRRPYIHLTFGPVGLALSGARSGFVFWCPSLLVRKNKIVIAERGYPLEIL
jgi:hypothetical protein